MKRIETLGELRKEYASIHSCATDTDRWLAKAFMFLIERGTFGSLRPHEQVQSEWNVFFGKGMKAGKSPKQISDEWHQRNNGKKDR